MSGLALRLSHKIVLIGVVGFAGVIAVGTIFLVGNTSQDASRLLADQARQIMAIDDKLQRGMLEARRAEKDFLLRHDEASLGRHAAVTTAIDQGIDELRATAKAFGLDTLADAAGDFATTFAGYKTHFATLRQSEIDMGLNETLGLSGRLRNSVHGIEAEIDRIGDPKLIAALLTMRRQEKDFMLRREAKYIEKFQGSTTNFEQVAAASDLAPAAKVDIGDKLQKYRTDFLAWADGAQRSAGETSAISKAFTQVEQVAAKVETDVAQRNRAAEASAAETGAALKRWMMIALAVTLLTMSVLSLAIANGVTKAIGAMVKTMVALARGDTQVQIFGLGRHDEIGEMSSAVEIFKTNMIEAERLRAAQAEAERHQVAQRKSDMAKLANAFESAVGEVIETVSSASTELEASATTLTSNTQRSQTVTATVAAACEQASANVQSVASATEEMASSVNEIGRQVQESARIAQEAVAQAQRTNDSVGELAQAATRIGDVVELINTIAGQTNLLALNATIEAARAGEAGRGFAVVASEVKALAEQTAKATGEISQQINGIQSATDQSVSAIREIGSTIARMSEIASTIASAVEEQGTATQEISRNVQQAALGTEQVSSGVIDVQRGTSETGSASSQVLSAAQALAKDSNRLKLEVGRFLETVRAA